MLGMEDFLRQSIADYNRRFAATMSAQPMGLQPQGAVAMAPQPMQPQGFVVGGEIRPKGIIPGPPSTEDNTLTPTASGEYILPTQATGLPAPALMSLMTHVMKHDKPETAKDLLDRVAMLTTGTPPNNMGGSAPGAEAPKGIRPMGFAAGGEVQDDVSGTKFPMPPRPDTAPADAAASTSKGITLPIATPQAANPEPMAHEMPPTAQAPLTTPAVKGIQPTAAPLEYGGDVGYVGLGGEKNTKLVDIDTNGSQVRAGYNGKVNGIVPGQPVNSTTLVDNIISRQPVGPDLAAIEQAVRVNAANGIMPTTEQMNTLGKSPADTVNLLAANNTKGQFTKAIDELQKQQAADAITTDAKARTALADAAMVKAKGLTQGGPLKPSGVAEDGRRVFYNKKGEQFVQGETGMEPYTGKVANINGPGAHGGSGEPLTPDNVKRYAEIYNRTGELPPLGRNTADRQAILNTAGDLARAEGATPEDIAVRHENFKSDKKSLAAVTKGMDTINSFEKGVQNSLSLVDKLSDGFSRGKYPGINKMSQLVAQHTGDPEVKAFKNALTTAMTEYMKVTTAGTGISSSELSIGAQQRAKELLEISDNPQTFKKSIDLMRQEMAIKKRSFEDQHGEIQIRLAGGSPAPMNTPERFMQDQGVNGIERARGLQPSTQAAPAASPPVQGARLAPDGKWYVSDPNRPGKYLQVGA